MAIRIAFTMRNKHAIYTTPLKALSNQKYADLCPMFGKENVGLSTGDIAINRGAPVTVMTTEVYRNIAWRASSGRNQEGIVRMGLEESDLEKNAVVVLDEVSVYGIVSKRVERHISLNQVSFPSSTTWATKAGVVFGKNPSLHRRPIHKLWAFPRHFRTHLN